MPRSLQGRPEKAFMDLLINEWDSTNVDYNFDESRRISTGWWDESNSYPQVTVTKITEDLSYDAISGSGQPVSWVPASIDVNCWVSFDSEVLNGENPMVLLHQLSREVARITFKNAEGTVNADNEVELSRIEPGILTRTPHANESPTRFQENLPVDLQWRMVGE